MFNPYANEFVNVSYELDWNGETIRPGTEIRFKYDRNVYRFRLLAHHTDLDKTWIDCFCVATRQYHSFYVDHLKGLHRRKKSRRRKKNDE